jgi:hypothetical protein
MEFVKILDDVNTLRKLSSTCLKAFAGISLEELLSALVSSVSPEDKFGPAGYDSDTTERGKKQRFVQGKKTFGYRIDFWNKKDAPAPTQDVFIED